MKKGVLFSMAILLCSINVSAAIKSIRWGSSGDPLSGLTITWTNTGANDSIKWGYSASLEQGSKIALKRTNAANTLEFFCSYAFNNVTPNATIHYKLYDSKAKTWGSEMLFNTAPPANTSSYCFLGLGDSRDDFTTWGQISNLAKAKNANFSLFTGDLIYNGIDYPDDWSAWFDSAATFLQSNLVYHSLGNHDANDAPQFQNTFDLPKTNGSNLYYSFKYGNGLFICLNSEAESSTTQYTWLKNTLASYQNDPDITWRVVFNHKPFYTIGSHAGEMDPYFNTWWKTFDDYGIDLIVNGHDHMYERTKPINRKTSTSTPVSTYGSGVGEGRCQIVCGGAGAPLYTGNSNVWFIEKYSSSFNYLEFCVNGNSLEGIAHDETDAVIDNFTITKPTTVDVKNNNQKFNPISIYPNPVETNFTLKYQSLETGKGTLKIVDMNGKILKTENVMKAQQLFENKFDATGLAAGMYYVEIQIDNQCDRTLMIIK